MVYRARDLDLDRVVALKVLKDGREASPEARDRWQREIEALGAIDHPSVVKVLSTGVSRGWPYFSMDYIEGPTLAARVDVSLVLVGPVPVRRTVVRPAC